MTIYFSIIYLYSQRPVDRHARMAEDVQAQTSAPAVVAGLERRA